MKLTKKYYIVLRDGEYITHGEGIVDQEIKTTATVNEFDSENEMNEELDKYDIPKELW
jgi:hypothetical protein